MSGGGKKFEKSHPSLLDLHKRTTGKDWDTSAVLITFFSFVFIRYSYLKLSFADKPFFSSNEVINCNARSLGWWKRVVAECLGNIKPLTRQGEHYKLDLTPLRFLHELLRMWLVNTWDHEMSAWFHSLCVIGFFHFPAAGLAVTVISMFSGN